MDKNFGLWNHHEIEANTQTMEANSWSCWRDYLVVVETKKSHIVTGPEVGTVALREIRLYQKSTELALSMCRPGNCSRYHRRSLEYAKRNTIFNFQF